MAISNINGYQLELILHPYFVSTTTIRHHIHANRPFGSYSTKEYFI